MKRTVLCLDIGTSSLKAALVDRDGLVPAFVRVQFDAREFRFHNPAVWLNALKKAADLLLDQLEESYGAAADLSERPVICALAVSGNGPTMVCDDYLLLWNEELNGFAARRAFGPSLFLPRLAYIRENLPSVWNSAPRFFSGPEYLIYRLCGAQLTILPEQRFEAAYWNEKTLADAGIESKKLPPFVGAGFCAGLLSEHAAHALGLADSPFAEKEIRVICGAPDFVVALVGTDTLEPGRVCDRAGSSEGINLCTAVPVRAEGVRALPSVLPDLWNASVLLPPAAIGSASAVDAKSTAEKVRAALETLRKASGLDITSMRVTGGQARDADLNQLKSDAAGIPVEVTALFDAELVGDAILAFTALGEYGSIREAARHMVRVSQTFLPR